MEDITGTVIERRIDDVIAMGSKANTVYKPRTEIKLNKNLHNYNPEQIQFTQDLNEELIHFLGYQADDTSTTPVFDYKGKASQKALEKKNMFKQYARKGFELRVKQEREGTLQNN